MAAIWIFIIAVVGAVLWCFTMGPCKNEPTDQGYCPANGALAHVVLLVDKTDPINFTQSIALEQLLSEFAPKPGTESTRVKEGERFTVFVLGEDFKATAEPLFDKCNPGTGYGKSDLTENIEHIKKRYLEGFQQPVLALKDSLVSKAPYKFSPIMEMLQLVAINGFRRADVKGPRNLVVVSDMLHNTEFYSLYKEQPDFTRFKQTSYYQKVHARLTDVKVELQYLMNTPTKQTLKNAKFWEDYFSDAEAELVAVIPMEG